MSLPDAADLGTLAFTSEGLPFATYQPTTANTNTLAFALAGALVLTAWFLARQ